MTEITDAETYPLDYPIEKNQIQSESVHQTIKARSQAMQDFDALSSQKNTPPPVGARARQAGIKGPSSIWI